MKKMVISLSTAKERREHIMAEFAQQDVDFEFFDAITPVSLDLAISQLGLDGYHSTLHQNEIGCLLSHMILWKKVVDEKLKYIAIFEDDIYLGEKAKDFLTNECWIPNECSLVKLEVFYKKIGIALQQQPFLVPNARQLCLLKEVHMGCGGYIISQEMAKKLLNFVITSKVLIPVDHVVFRECPQVNVYQLMPALCIQDMILTQGKTRFPSALEDVRNIRKGQVVANKIKLKFSEKIKKEGVRILNRIQKIIVNYNKYRQGIKIVKIKFR